MNNSTANNNPLSALIPKKKAVAYERFSSNNQDYRSIEYQHDAIVKYCNNNNIDLVNTYVDPAYSGRNVKRPAFQQMIEDAKNNPKWSMILAYDSSRLFRNRRDAANYREDLKDLDIDMIGVTEPNTKTISGRLMVAMLDVWNDYFSEDNARKTHDALMVNAKQALHCGGVPPLGYKVDKKGKLKIERYEAEIVKEIFDLFEADISYKKMAERLNAKGYKTRGNRDFSKNSFHDILTNTKYIGIYSWNRTKPMNSKGERNNHKYKNKEEIQTVINGCPAIISKEQFERVQDKLEERTNGSATSKARHHYMLSGLKVMKCANCGSRMIGKIGSSHGKKYIAYYCPNHKDGKCPTTEIRAENLDFFVAKAVTARIVNKKNFAEINRLVRNNSHSDEEKILRNRLKGLNMSIANTTKSIQRKPSLSLDRALEGLEEEKKIVKNKLNKIAIPAPDITADNLVILQRQLQTYLIISDDSEAKKIIKTYVKEILVDNNDIEISVAA